MSKALSTEEVCITCCKTFTNCDDSTCSSKPLVQKFLAILEGQYDRKIRNRRMVTLILENLRNSHNGKYKRGTNLSICSSCSKEMESICSYYHEMKCVELKLLWKMRTLRSRMNFGGRIPERMKVLKETCQKLDTRSFSGTNTTMSGNHDIFEVVREFRDEVMRECRRLALSPKVVLSRDLPTDLLPESFHKGNYLADYVGALDVDCDIFSEGRQVATAPLTHDDIPLVDDSFEAHNSQSRRRKMDIDDAHFPTDYQVEVKLEADNAESSNLWQSEDVQEEPNSPASNNSPENLRSDDDDYMDVEDEGGDDDQSSSSDKQKKEDLSCENEEEEAVCLSESGGNQEQDNNVAGSIRLQGKGKKKVVKSTWKSEVNKINRMFGYNYEGREAKKDVATGKITYELVQRGKRVMGPRCNSSYCAKRKYSCHDFSEEERIQIFNLFWKTKTWNEKREIVSSLVDRVPVRRRKVGAIAARKESRIYFLKLNERKVKVCQEMFRNTMGLKKDQILKWLQKNDEPAARAPKSKQTGNRRSPATPHVHEYLDLLPKLPPNYSLQCTSKYKFYKEYKKFSTERSYPVASVFLFSKIMDAKNIACFMPRKCERSGNDDDQNKVTEENKEEECHVCETCGKSYRGWENLKAHRKVHLDKSSWKFTCEYCEKKFHSKSPYVHHVRTHTKEKPDLCSICGKCFSNKTYLRYHVRRMHESKKEERPEISDLTKRKRRKKNSEPDPEAGCSVPVFI